MGIELEEGLRELPENVYSIGILSYEDESETATLLYQTEVDGEHLAELEDRNSLSVTAASANLSDPSRFDEEDKDHEFFDFLEEFGYELKDYADGFGHNAHNPDWRSGFLEELEDERLRKNIEGADRGFDYAHILAVKKDEKSEPFEDVLERGERMREEYLEWKGEN